MDARRRDFDRVRTRQLEAHGWNHSGKPDLKAAARRTAPRICRRPLVLRDDDAPTGVWDFPQPLGEQAVMGEFTMADTVTISRHIRTPEIRSYMTLAAVRDVVAPDAAPPVIEASGRSAQRFIVEVVARQGQIERRAVARGQDIYAFTAPLVVEAAERVINGVVKGTGVFTAGEAFDAPDFLRALCPRHLAFELWQQQKALVRA